MVRVQPRSVGGCVFVYERRKNKRRFLVLVIAWVDFYARTNNGSYNKNVFLEQKMKLIYTGEKFVEYGKSFSVFMAGPTPRSSAVKSWRPEMIGVLKSRGFTGIAIVPEYRSYKSKKLKYSRQVEWEVECLNNSTAIMFWVPRNMKFFPALTTNIEFGEFMHSGKVILGYPTNAEHMDYFKARSEMLDIPTFNDMTEVADIVINKEKVFLYECERCYGSGRRESNGYFYRCAKCDGKGFLSPPDKKHR
jgi:hypothetical protein